MACGMLVVTSNSSSLPEVAGDAALLVAPYDVVQIVQAMWLVLSHLALAVKLQDMGWRKPQFIDGNELSSDPKCVQTGAERVQA